MTTIHHSKVLEALELLGINDHEAVKTVLIGRHGVAVERHDNASEVLDIDWTPTIIAGLDNSAADAGGN